MELLEKIPVEFSGKVYDVEVLESPRARSMRLSISPDAEIRVVVPRRLFGYKKLVLKFLSQKKTWLEKTLKRVEKSSVGKIRLPEAPYDKQNLKIAKAKLESRVWYLAQKYGFHFKKISVRNQSSRWGSCSGQGTLSFNWRLILLPQELSDYVILHEFVHLEHHNHSKIFWQKLEQICPNANLFRKQLKKYIY